MNGWNGWNDLNDPHDPYDPHGWDGWNDPHDPHGSENELNEWNRFGSIFGEPGERWVAFEDAVVVLFGPMAEHFKGKAANLRHVVFV